MICKIRLLTHYFIHKSISFAYWLSSESFKKKLPPIPTRNAVGTPLAIRSLITRAVPCSVHIHILLTLLTGFPECWGIVISVFSSILKQMKKSDKNFCKNTPWVVLFFRDCKVATNKSSDTKLVKNA